MSLNYSLTDIKDHETLCWAELEDGRVRMKPRTEEIIFSCMAVEIGKITEENYKEFYYRLKLWDTLSMFENRNTIPLEDIKAHVGLSTNVYPSGKRNPGWTDFCKKLRRNMNDRCREERTRNK
jgi:hypothetical protein